MIVSTSQTGFLVAIVLTLIFGVLWLLFKPLANKVERDERDAHERQTATVNTFVENRANQALAQRAIDAARKAKKREIRTASKKKLPSKIDKN